MIHRRAVCAGLVLIISGCATFTAIDFEQKFGAAAPRERVVNAVKPGDQDYWQDVKPVLEQRCVVCHACYDAPCQLKLSSIEGIERGASPVRVYDQSRLTKATPTRLFEDAHSVSGWRALGFHPVLNEYGDTAEANRQAGVMYQLLTLKEQNPLPMGPVLPDSFDFAMDRKEFCAQAETFDEYARKHPLQGMPYALPGIEADEQAALLNWLEQGADYTARAPLAAGFTQAVQVWEAFLNDDSQRSQLAARYIYEHLFLTHLYFAELSDRQFFKIVRSATPPGEPLQLIATRRPYDDPGVARVYYRIIEEPATIVAKTHMPYALTPARMDRWRSWFVDADFQVAALPAYDAERASNPFITFADLPLNSRYRFLLDEAQNTIMSFIKGPVCRGQVALDVINDRFWVFFIDPDDAKLRLVEEFLSRQAQGMALPASTESIFRPIEHWRKYSKQQKALLAATDEYLSEHYQGPDDLSLDVVWDGDGSNDNAALTVFRHFNSATVEKGLIGTPPKTAWLIGYELLERIHYLLVAGYDVYGNVGHQLFSRVYMDFLRMEGETAFLMLLPRTARDRERAFWYRQAEKEVEEFMVLPRFESKLVPGIAYKTEDQKNELFSLLKKRLGAVLPARHDLSTLHSLEPALAALQDLQGQAVTLMPQVAFVQIRGQRDNSYVTVLRNNAHLNITSLFREKKFRVPAEDTLSVVPGFIGAYPNVFLVVDEAGVEDFVETVSNMRVEGDYTRMLDVYGVRRTASDFWRHSDVIHAAYRQTAPVEYGLFDYNRLENR